MLFCASCLFFNGFSFSCLRSANHRKRISTHPNGVRADTVGAHHRPDHHRNALGKKPLALRYVLDGVHGVGRHFALSHAVLCSPHRAHQPATTAFQSPTPFLCVSCSEKHEAEAVAPMVENMDNTHYIVPCRKILSALCRGNDDFGTNFACEVCVA